MSLFKTRFIFRDGYEIDLDYDSKREALRIVKEIAARHGIMVYFRRLKESVPHRHGECLHYSRCKQEVIKDGGEEKIRFACPMREHARLYHKSKFEQIQEYCDFFEPLNLGKDPE